VRLLDRFVSRQGYWEGMASGAAVLTTTYGTPDREAILPQFTAATHDAYRENGIVFAAIAARAMLLSEATFTFQSTVDKRLFGTPELAILERPWPNGTTGELLVRMEQDASLAGNAYIWNAGEQLVRLRPDWVTIVTEEVTDDLGMRSYRRPVGYWYEPPAVSQPMWGPPQMYDVSEMAHWCADEETEILTAGGWKDFNGLDAGDEVLTLNRETGLSEWQPVLEVLVFPAQRREMISMEGKEFSSLTTPNHRWPVEYRSCRSKTYKRRWVTSDTLRTNDRIPVAAYSADLPREQKWTDALVEVVAWFWTEGRFSSSSKPGSKGRGISIAQSVKNTNNGARIRAALTVLFGPPVERIPIRGPRSDVEPCWGEYRDGDIAIFRLSANAGDIITAHAPHKIVTTTFLRSLTAAQLDLFIKVSLLADNNGPNRLAQKSRAMAEQFALACILAGYGVSIREGCLKDGVNTFGDGYRMWDVRILRKRYTYPVEHDRPGAAFRNRRVAYDGHVWCPRTRNETWLARRKGSVYFTGNSPIPDPDAQFRGMSWLTPVLREIGADDAMTAYKRKYLENSATPNLLIRYERQLNPETVDRIRDRVQARYGGVQNAFKTLVLDQGADATVVGHSFEQMNFSTVQAAGENRILIASRVPGIVVGAKEGLLAATYSNFLQAMRSFADLWARPTWRSACACLEKLVANVPKASRLWYDTADIAALRQGEKERADTLLVKAQAIAELVKAGFDAASAVAALDSGDLTQLAAPDAAAGRGGADEARNIVEMIQKVYLGVGPVVSTEEARTLLNRAGAGLPAARIPTPPIIVPSSSGSGNLPAMSGAATPNGATPPSGGGAPVPAES
jgi:phage portal protein BeeE